MLLVETTAGAVPPVDFQGDTAPLVYFMSFAAAERFGAQHELAQAASLLKRQLKIDLTPLLRFSSAEVEDASDVEELDALWQDALPLAEAASRVAEALRSHPRLRELVAPYPGLADRLDELAAIARWAADQGARIRLTYLL
jgi:hypothetical protein